MYRGLERYLSSWKGNVLRAKNTNPSLSQAMKYDALVRTDWNCAGTKGLDVESRAWHRAERGLRTIAYHGSDGPNMETTKIVARTMSGYVPMVERRKYI
jgi:hypothetical protein